MNTPSPAPNRRRRRIDIAAPEEAQPANPQPLSAGEPVRRARRPAQESAPLNPAPACASRRPRKKSARRASSSISGFLEQIPLPVRIVLITLCIAVFLTCAVAITRNYLAEQEARRRLEAEAAERAQHPLQYPGMIIQYAAMQDIDPALVAAIILCESSYNPQAESYLGARGLMQLMEDTAGWVAQKLGEDSESYSFDRMYDPETNIRFGTWYLGYLSRRFDGDATKIVCAYHAGQGNVDSWLKNPQYSRDGVTLDVIPTNDTATYASRVLRARDVYRKYYFPVSQQTPSAP